MSNEIQLDFLKDLLIDIFNNNEVLYDDLNEVKSHIINTMKLSFDDVNIEQIEYNLPKLIKFNFQLNINDGTIIHKKDDIQIHLLLLRGCDQLQVQALFDQIP